MMPSKGELIEESDDPRVRANICEPLQIVITTGNNRFLSITTTAHSYTEKRCSISAQRQLKTCSTFGMFRAKFKKKGRASTYG